VNRRKGIEAAFRRLPVLEEKEPLLQAAVKMLADVDCAGPGTIPPNSG